MLFFSEVLNVTSMASFTVVKANELKTEQNHQPTLRQMTSELGCLTRQDGSASLSHGDTTVLAVVYGPAEVRINKELIDRATVEVTYKPKVGLPRPADRKRERIIRNTLEAAIMAELHPRSSISIIIQETEDKGSNLACCVNAACLALLDASVSLKFMVAAVSVAVKKDTGEIVADPVKRDEEEARAIFTFVFDSNEKKVVSVITSGNFCQDEYKRGLDMSRKASEIVFQFYRDALSKKLLNSA